MSVNAILAPVFLGQIEIGLNRIMAKMRRLDVNAAKKHKKGLTSSEVHDATKNVDVAAYG